MTTLDIRKVHYFCRECPQKNFGDPEHAPSFAAWMATVRGHIISFHRALKSNEEPNAFLTPIYLLATPAEILPEPVKS